MSDAPFGLVTVIGPRPVARFRHRIRGHEDRPGESALDNKDVAAGLGLSGEVSTAEEAGEGDDDGGGEDAPMGWAGIRSLLKKCLRDARRQ